MSRLTPAARRSMILVTLVAIGALSACADPTAPSERTAGAEVRNGYLVSCGAKDSTSGAGGSEQ